MASSARTVDGRGLMPAQRTDLGEQISSRRDRRDTEWGALECLGGFLRGKSPKRSAPLRGWFSAGIGARGGSPLILQSQLESTIYWGVSYPERRRTSSRQVRSYFSTLRLGRPLRGWIVLGIIRWWMTLCLFRRPAAAVRPSSAGFDVKEAIVLRKYAFAWIPMVFIGILNGTLRDLGYGRHFSELTAHQISTAIGILLFGLFIWHLTRRWKLDSGKQALTVGLIWLGLTIIFEFIFGHYVMGNPWSWLLHDYDLSKGRVWVLVLIWVTIAPYVFYRLSRASRPDEPA